MDGVAQRTLFSPSVYFKKKTKKTNPSKVRDQTAEDVPLTMSIRAAVWTGTHFVRPAVTRHTQADKQDPETSSK